MTSAITRPTRSAALPDGAGDRSRAIAAGLSIVGSAVAFVIAGAGLLTVPIAAVIVFGPALVELL